MGLTGTLGTQASVRPKPRSRRARRGNHPRTGKPRQLAPPSAANHPRFPGFREQDTRGPAQRRAQPASRSRAAAPREPGVGTPRALCGPWRCSTAARPPMAMIHKPQSGARFTRARTQRQYGRRAHGAIAFYLGNRATVDAYLARQDAVWNRAREAASRSTSPVVARLRAEAARTMSIQ